MENFLSRKPSVSFSFIIAATVMMIPHAHANGARRPFDASAMLGTYGEAKCQHLTANPNSPLRYRSAVVTMEAQNLRVRVNVDHQFESIYDFFYINQGSQTEKSRSEGNCYTVTTRTKAEGNRIITDVKTSTRFLCAPWIPGSTHRHSELTKLADGRLQLESRGGGLDWPHRCLFSAPAQGF